MAERCAELDKEFERLPLPFTSVLLGMGADGHFASLFPDAEDLDKGLIADWQQLIMPVHTAASPHPRISLTLAALSRSDEIVLLIFGEAKREVFEAAKTPAITRPWQVLRYCSPSRRKVARSSYSSVSSNSVLM